MAAPGKARAKNAHMNQFSPNHLKKNKVVPASPVKVKRVPTNKMR